MQFAYLAVVREGTTRVSERTNTQVWLKSLLVTDFALRFPEALHQLSKWVEEGTIHYREQVREGIEQAPGAIQRLYSAENTGKLVIRLSGAHATA